MLSQVKLIAEPWDLGEGGYQVGNFPVGWAEWNGKYRDTMRAFWKGDGGLIGELAQRLTGSSDLYGTSGRNPNASINFITAHDGFTLHDLVSYNDKHNEANGEDNRDGTDNNLSWNSGVEGATDDPAIKALRSLRKRNFLTTLLFSQGVPMLLSGDEIGHTQAGNNNAYCQDSELSWLDWNIDADGRDMLEFVERLIRLRRTHPVFRKRHFFQGRSIRGKDVKDIMWLSPEGREMSDEEWDHSHARCLGVYLSGDALNDRDARGKSLLDDNFLVLFNAHHEEVRFTIANYDADTEWEVLLDTHYGNGLPDEKLLRAGAVYPLQGRSVAMLTSRRRKP